MFPSMMFSIEPPDELVENVVDSSTPTSVLALPPLPTSHTSPLFPPDGSEVESVIECVVVIAAVPVIFAPLLSCAVAPLASVSAVTVSLVKSISVFPP